MIIMRDISVCVGNSYPSVLFVMADRLLSFQWPLSGTMLKSMFADGFPDFQTDPIPAISTTACKSLLKWKCHLTMNFGLHLGTLLPGTVATLNLTKP